MKTGRFSLLVQAPTATVWQILLDKVWEPQKHTPAIESIEILERDGDASCLRKMTTRNLEVVERITIDAERWTIVSEYVEHPRYTGTFTKLLSPPQNPDGYPTLTFSLSWASKDPDVDVPNLDSLALKGVKHAKQVAEAQALKDRLAQE